MQNLVEDMRMSGEISRAEAAKMMAELSAKKQLDAYEYDNSLPYQIKTYGPETQEEIDLDKEGAYEESRREEDTDSGASLAELDRSLGDPESEYEYYLDRDAYDIAEGEEPSETEEKRRKWGLLDAVQK